MTKQEIISEIITNTLTIDEVLENAGLTDESPEAEQDAAMEDAFMDSPRTETRVYLWKDGSFSSTTYVTGGSFLYTSAERDGECKRLFTYDDKTFFYGWDDTATQEELSEFIDNITEYEMTFEEAKGLLDEKYGL